MTTDHTQRAQLDDSIDAIEAGYEYLLAYAAQGRRTDRGGGGDSEVREHLEKMAAALRSLAAHARECASAINPNLLDDCKEFFDAVAADAATARAAIGLVQAQSDISSQIIDNLNASIHLRAALTDIFLIDEALK